MARTLSLMDTAVKNNKRKRFLKPSALFLVSTSVGLLCFQNCTGSFSSMLGTALSTNSVRTLASGGSSSTANAITPMDANANLVGSMAPIYNGFGQHFPQGLSAAQYLYGPEGTFQAYTNLQNIYQYYSGYSGAYGNQQPTGTSWQADQLIGYANGQNATSVPDANNHALFNLAAGQSTCTSAVCYSFEEHSGKGVAGVATSTPFSQFWFDDNWLARNVSYAYGAPRPGGLFDANDFTRWKILNLDNSNWVPYANPGNDIDLLAMNGMYQLSVGNPTQALAIWNQILQIAGSNYDADNQRYNYPGVVSEYQLGLFKILTDQLINSGALAQGDLNELIQHSIALRSNILSDQQQENGSPIGWLTGDGTTSRVAPQSLINTETTSVNILGLSAQALLSFEVGRSPLDSQCTNCFLRPHNVLSAVVGLTSSSVFMSYGPYTTINPGNYVVDFYLRSPSPSGNVAYVDACNNYGTNIFASQTVVATDMLSGNQWTRISLPIQVQSGNSDNMEFRVFWYGGANLDVSTIRVRNQ